MIGLIITELCTDMFIMIAGYQRDDDSNVVLHFNYSARGVPKERQIDCGQENNLCIRMNRQLNRLE